MSVRTKKVSDLSPQQRAQRRKYRAHLRQTAGRRCQALRRIGDDEIEWRCRQGHEFSTPFFPTKDVLKPGEFSRAFLFRYWSRGAGCSIVCPQCLKAKYDEIDVEFGLRQATNQEVTPCACGDDAVVTCDGRDLCADCHEARQEVTP